MDLPVEGSQILYDNALMGVLQNCGKLQPFLDAIFCFLARRTDFYIIMKHERAKMGFPPGAAENMVHQAFKKYEILTRKREVEIMCEEESQKVERMSQVSPSASAGSGTTKTKKQPKETKDQPQETKDQPQENNTDELPILVPGRDTLTEKTQEGGGEGKASSSGEKMENKLPKKVDLDGKDSKKKKRAMAFNYTSDVYNGGEMEGYKWSQTMTEVELKVALPEATTSKHVRVDIRSNYLRVEIMKPKQKTVLDGKLTNKVKVEDSMWNVDRETCTLCVNLEKTKEIMWKSVLEGEEGIDLTKVDTTRDVSEFDQEAQAAIQRVSYDHHMKMQGLPTSSDKKAHDILKKAWDAEGSPFKGTPFDPSRIQISGTWN